MRAGGRGWGGSEPLSTPFDKANLAIRVTVVTTRVRRSTPRRGKAAAPGTACTSTMPAPECVAFAARGDIPTDIVSTSCSTSRNEQRPLMRGRRSSDLKNASSLSTGWKQSTVPASASRPHRPRSFHLSRVL